VLDLGCAGGGLVEDFLEAGHDAYGIDGAEAAKREAWLRHPERFFQADISRSFYIEGRCFDVVTAFEVLEHLSEQSAIGLVQKVDVYLQRRGIFIATISLVPDEVDGVQYHQTVRPADWWREVLEGNGFTLLDDPFTEEEWPRKEQTSLRVVARRMA
jgi:2-polyprenyl-3-methyl-5-hydroxy-6-metoxy-1,4-benzoquinol methylase